MGGLTWYIVFTSSPLAEGRELKFVRVTARYATALVAPRGGA